MTEAVRGSLFAVTAILAWSPGIPLADPGAAGADTDGAEAPPDVCGFAHRAYAEGRLIDARRYAAMCGEMAPDAADSMALLQARIEIRLDDGEQAMAALGRVGGAERKYAAGYEALARMLADGGVSRLELAPERERRDAVARLRALTLLPGDDPIDALRRGALARLHGSLGERAAMVRETAALPAASADRAALMARAEVVLADETSLTDAEIDGLWSETAPDSPLRSAVARARAARALGSGDVETARAAMAEIEATGARPAWLADLRARLDRIAAVDARRIGALLPLSGPSAEVGTRALRAMEVAAAAAGLRVEARDTRSDAGVTRAAVRSLADEARVVAIAGPIEARVAAAAAAEAAALGVPMIALNVQRGIASAARCVFRGHPTYESEVDALAAYAAERARGRRFAVMRAEGRYGEILEAALRAAVERRGGEVVHVGAYPAGRTSFLDEAKALRRATPDAVLFADAPSRVALLVPALAYEDVWPQPHPHDRASRRPASPRAEALYLLPSAAIGPEALAEARRYLEGAVGAVGLIAASSDDARTAFERAFVEAVGAAPAQLDAYAHDAVAVIGSLVRGGASNHPALCRALAEAESGPTVAPFAGFAPDGEPRRPVRLVVVRNGVVTSIDQQKR